MKRTLLKGTLLSLVVAIATMTLALTSCGGGYSNEAYTWKGDRIIQGDFTSRAISSEEIASTYINPVNPYRSPIVDFKFCINAEDGEMPSGSDHRYVVETPEHNATQLIRYGVQSVEGDAAKESYMVVNMPVTFKVDLSPVIDSFEEKGYYIDAFGNRINEVDFKGVWVAGSCPPLTWNFDELKERDDLQMTTTDGRIFTLTLTLNSYEVEESVENRWRLSTDISQYARYEAPTRLEEAVYNLSLEESLRAIEPDSTFRTGKEWSGVWTRDVSYSIILSMAHLQPEVAKISLRRKVDSLGRIVQDTGTGGSYPCSTDRIVWAAAAWEIYQATGDKEWLDEIYPIIRRSVDQDIAVAWNEESGLMRGESSFLDWREQEYPRWMNPVDIYLSECLGTNAVHYRAMEVLAEMCRIYGDEPGAEYYGGFAERIKESINTHLWDEESGCYAGFRYGRRSMILSRRSETLGEALCIIWGIADAERAKTISRNLPCEPFGTPNFYPQIPSIPPYHNDAMWPFVQSYWMRASAQAGNEEGVMHSIGAIYRAAMMFLTNKENMEISGGDWTPTQINSSNMLWSLSGNLSIVYHTLFGMRFSPEGLAFEPFVPRQMKGERKLTGFAYRGGEYDITLKGSGNTIKRFLLDGKESQPFVSADLEGHHTIEITLGGTMPKSTINMVPNVYSPETPQATIEGAHLCWAAVEGAESYKVLCNGEVVEETNRLTSHLRGDGEWQVVAVSAEGVEGFASEPVDYYGCVVESDIERGVRLSRKGYEDYRGRGFVNLSREENRTVEFTIEAPETGIYNIELLYANANGPINTDNCCAMRTLLVDSNVVGTVVFAQRGEYSTNLWYYTNPIEVSLSKGRHRVRLEFREENENMNIATNQAALDGVRLTKVN